MLKTLKRFVIERLKPEGLKGAEPPAWRSWFEGKDFSVDYTTQHIERWADLLGSKSHVRDILEVGALEGMSAIVWLELFPESRITCIDNFAGTPTQPANPQLRAQIPFREGRFNENLAGYADRVRKIKARSAPALDALYDSGETFDLIYIDADHRCNAVLADSALALQILRRKGILIWDDYKWRESPDRPGPAIDAILALYGAELLVLHKRYQVIVEKH